MATKYWLDLFTGKTWEEFLKNGGTISGFRSRRMRLAQQIHPGDYLICYLTGISRVIGMLEICSEMFVDETPIWEDEEFPCRFKVKIVYQLKPEHAVPILDLKEKLALFKKIPAGKQWSGFFRGSPALFDDKDGNVILDALKDAANNPVARPYDEKKYWRHPKVYVSNSVGVVTVPEEQEEEKPEVDKGKSEAATHEEIQWRLLKLGADLGLDIWVARNDRNREYDKNRYQDLRNLRTELPRQFDDATNRTIELIDVLWLQGDAIVAAFEVEHTSAIYSGLLRMADLVSMQPNIKLNLYLVAPDDRRDKVISEINRPTFAKLKPPLPKICKFIPYSLLRSEVDAIGNRMRFMKPEFIEEIAESCETEEV